MATTPPQKPKVKWTRSIAFFAVFFASFLSLLVTGLVWLELVMLSHGAMAASIGTMGLLCVVSFVLWVITENTKGR